MFDSVTVRSSRAPHASLTTRAFSAIAHAAVVTAIALSGLQAADVLPDPPDMMAFVVTTPAPPPPPPPAAPAAETPKRARTPKRAQPMPARAAVPKPAVAAPVEAPSAIRPETGFEGGTTVDAGFEHGVPGGIAGGVIGGILQGSDRLVPPPPAPTTPVRVGGEILAPRLTRRVEPEYPFTAARAQIEGVVILEAMVSSQGAVQAVRVLRSHPLLEDAAVTAVKQWEYEPLTLNGQPYPFVLTVTVSFNLS